MISSIIKIRKDSLTRATNLHKVRNLLIVHHMQNPIAEKPCSTKDSNNHLVRIMFNFPPFNLIYILVLHFL